MMLSFVPKIDISRVVATPTCKNPFHTYIHRCFVPLDRATTSVNDIIHIASSKLDAHLLLSSAYKGESPTPFKILSVWALNDDGPIQVVRSFHELSFIVTNSELYFEVEFSTRRNNVLNF